MAVKRRATRPVKTSSRAGRGTDSGGGRVGQQSGAIVLSIGEPCSQCSIVAINPFSPYTIISRASVCLPLVSESVCAVCSVC